jgi:uncharacterized membrane protein YfcA
LLVIVLNSAAGFLGTLNHAQVDYRLVSAIAFSAIAGSFLGSRLAARIPPESLRRAFAGFVVAMAVFILVREGTLLATTVAPALPTTWPQVVFAIGMLGIGIAAGRSSKNATLKIADYAYSEGGGI